MSGRVAGRAAIVVGAGQRPGETIGNGRAIALRLGQEGARVLCVDRHPDSAAETVSLIREAGGEAEAFTADITCAADVQALVQAGLERFGGLDILVNNVGMGGNEVAGEGPPHILEEQAFDGIMAVNLKGMWLTIKAAIPHMRKARGASIVNISSVASYAGHRMLAYEMSKAAVNRLTVSVALSNAKYGLRCNAVLPGLMDTPLAIESGGEWAGRSADDQRAVRNAVVPLNAKMGTGWDTANAVLFLASDEAAFVTGVLLPVDGGMGARIG